jgi:hypothetical protein
MFTIIGVIIMIIALIIGCIGVGLILTNKHSEFKYITFLFTLATVVMLFGNWVNSYGDALVKKLF